MRDLQEKESAPLMDRCRSCGRRLNCITLLRLPCKVFEDAITESEVELQKIGLDVGKKRHLVFIADVDEQEVQKLRLPYLAELLGCELIINESYKVYHDQMREIDKRIEVVKGVFARHGLDLEIMYNTRYSEDWSNCTSESKDFLSPEFPDDFIPELFHELYETRIFKLFGVYDRELFANSALMFQSEDDLQGIEFDSSS